MEPPVTPKPMPASSPDLPINHTSKLFGIVYIILTGVVDTIVPAASLWSWVGNSASYLLKLAPLLWWTLPAKTLAQVAPGNGRPAAQDWIPENHEETFNALPFPGPSAHFLNHFAIITENDTTRSLVAQKAKYS
ncbi:hypothetical protein DSO57_1001693 [Entomophthora muscae]|uniref:Uncharacterized protein n=1 Tax=Entomophthora muscae TaxID=34485 RepID=A0ACC2TWT8_9FUNG|nr:hypothetical protein DSO57_1001693 [Entomophthora muscae]